MHCASSCPCFFPAVVGQERASACASHALFVIVLVLPPRPHWAGTRSTICITCDVRHSARASSSPSFGKERARASASHALCVIVLVHIPRLHWAGTRSTICITCIVRHRARVSSSPSLGKDAPVHLHRMHCASSFLCIFIDFIGQERARPAASHALCDIVPVCSPRFIGQERARASASHALCVIVLVHLPRLHWAGTRSASCIACIVRHRARVSPRLHWAGTRSCIDISCIVPRNGCPDNIGGGRCPAPVLLGAPRQCLADGLRLVAGNGWGRHVGAAAAVRAIAKGRDDVNPRNDAWRERLAMCRWRRCTI